MNKKGDAQSMLYLIFGALVAVAFIFMMLNKVAQLTNFRELAANYHLDEMKNTLEAMETQKGYFQTGYYLGNFEGACTGFNETQDKSSGVTLKQLFLRLPESKGGTECNGESITRPLLVSVNDQLSPSSIKNAVKSQYLLLSYDTTSKTGDNLNVQSDTICDPNNKKDSYETLNAKSLKAIQGIYFEGKVTDDILNNANGRRSTILILTSQKKQECDLFWQIQSSFKAQVQMAQVPQSMIDYYTRDKVMVIVS